MINTWYRWIVLNDSERQKLKKELEEIRLERRL